MANLSGNNPPRITVVSGFLGSGKTTLIKKMFREGYLGENPVLLENDYGSLGIDGELIKSMGLRVSELLSGCICCSLKTEFPYELSKLIETTNCDHLIVEPSGIGKLSDILSAITLAEASWEPGLSICLVDVRMFNDYQNNFPFVYWDQIMESDVVIFNFAREARSDEVQQAMNAIYERDPDKVIICNDATADVSSLLAKIPNAAQQRALDIRQAKNNKGNEEADNIHHDHKSPFVSFAKDMPGVWPKGKVQCIMSSLTDNERFGTVLRAKALVRSDEGILSVNFIPGRLRVEKLKENEAVHFVDGFEGRVMVVGTALNCEALDRLFSQ